MDTHAVHITFIRHRNSMVPWIVSITSDKFKSTLIGLSTVGLVFSYEDIEFNSRMVPNFPLPKSLKFDHMLKLEDFAEKLYRIYSQEIGGGDFCPELIALDCPTYHYMLDVVSAQNLKLSYSNPDYKTLAAVQRYENKIDYSHVVHVTFIRYDNKMIPWHISMTSPNSKTTMIGLDTKDLVFNYEDFEYNISNVENFPRSIKLDVVLTIEEFSEKFYEMYGDFYDQWFPYLALDQPTYHYLLKIFVNSEKVKLVDPITADSEDKTLSVIYAQSLANNPF